MKANAARHGRRGRSIVVCRSASYPGADHVKRDVLMRAGTIEVVRRGASHYDFRDPYHIALEMSWKGFALAFFGLDLGTMAPVTLYGHVVSAIEIVCGMVFTAIMTGLLFVRFSNPRSKILFAD